MSTAFLPLHRTVPPSLTTMSSLAPATEPERWTAKRSADGVPQPARAARATSGAAAARRIAATLAAGFRHQPRIGPLASAHALPQARLGGAGRRVRERRVPVLEAPDGQERRDAAESRRCAGDRLGRADPPAGDHAGRGAGRRLIKLLPTSA